MTPVERLGIGLGVLALGIALFLGLPPSWWSDMPPPAVHVGVGLGVVLILFGVLLILQSAWKARKGHKMWPVIGMAIFGVGFVACATWYLWPAGSAKDHASKLDYTILVECFWSQFPSTVPPYGLQYWELTASAGDGGVLSTSQQPGSMIEWNLGEPTHFEACQLTNFGGNPIVRIEMLFRLEYLEVAQQENRTASGAVVISKEIPNPPFRLGTGEKNTYIFYMRNRSPYWARVQVPTTARVQIAGSEELQIARLIPPTSMKNYATMPPYFPTNPPDVGEKEKRPPAARSMATRRIQCITKLPYHEDRHRRIQAVGGPGWRDSEDTAIANVKRDPSAYEVTEQGKTVKVIVKKHDGREYLKTEDDRFLPDNLLSFPEC